MADYKVIYSHNGQMCTMTVQADNAFDARKVVLAKVPGAKKVVAVII